MQPVRKTTNALYKSVKDYLTKWCLIGKGGQKSSCTRFYTLFSGLYWTFVSRTRQEMKYVLPCRSWPREFKMESSGKGDWIVHRYFKCMLPGLSLTLICFYKPISIWHSWLSITELISFSVNFEAHNYLCVHTTSQLDENYNLFKLRYNQCVL